MKGSTKRDRVWIFDLFFDENSNNWCLIDGSFFWAQDHAFATAHHFYTSIVEVFGKYSASNTGVPELRLAESIALGWDWIISPWAEGFEMVLRCSATLNHCEEDWKDDADVHWIDWSFSFTIWFFDLVSGHLQSISVFILLEKALKPSLYCPRIWPKCHFEIYIALYWHKLTRSKEA